ncbi:MAG: hypothetical protein HY376_01870 [Candidatus Blackburnbacteria bacterium]|nr:hypothetical protein [Candidatus Blackburnbacteria bacterium]
MKNLQQLIEKKCKEFEDKFVKPTDSKMRAMNLNGDPYAIGKAGDIKLFLHQSLTECAKATADAVRGGIIEEINNRKILIVPNSVPFVSNRTELFYRVGYSNALKDTLRFIMESKEQEWFKKEA